MDPSTLHEKPNPRTSDHLANERTFLAWTRTSIAVLGLGFVVAVAVMVCAIAAVLVAYMLVTA